MTATDTVIERWMIQATRDDRGFANLGDAALLAQLVARQRTSSSWVCRSDEECAADMAASVRTIQRMRHRLVRSGHLECRRRLVGDRVLMHWRVRRPAGRRRSSAQREALVALVGGPLPGDGAWVVYRHFDCNGRLLYVGRTAQFEHRHASHRNRTPWWPEVDRITSIPYGSYELCAAAEAEAIATEAPVNNRQGRR
jgi:hypothetical protein